MVKCTDPKAGELIHAYELNALPEEERERFEIHFLTCEHCLKEIESFEREAAVMNYDDELKKAAKEKAGDALSESESLFSKLRQYLWPEAPIIFKPAMAYIVVLLLVLPAYNGMTRLKSRAVRPVQSISLIPMRSVQERIVRTASGTDVLISFVFDGAEEGSLYEVILASEDDEIIFSDDAFSGFDEIGMGGLICPEDKLKPGRYQLKIINPRDDTPTGTQDYSFTVE